MTMALDRRQVLTLLLAGSSLLTDTGRAIADLLPADFISQDVAGTTLVDDRAYSHFPVVALLPTGRIAACYYQGTSHGSRDEEAVCLRASRPTAGPLPIDGHAAGNGRVELVGGSRITIDSTADESTRNFIISGIRVGGEAAEERIAGPAKGTAVTETYWLIVSRAEVDGPCNGAVAIGVDEMPSDIVLRTSDDGATWSDPIVIGDGIRSGIRHYYNALGADSQGRLLAMFTRIVLPQNDVAERVVETGLRISGDDGLTWTDFSPLSIAGHRPASTLAAYGPIREAPGGALCVSAYSGDDNLFLRSDDGGATWTSTLVVTARSPGYSEMALACLSRDVFLLAARVDGVRSAMRLFRTEDGGATWTDSGPLDLPVSGGWASPWLEAADGGRRLLFAVMLRQSVSERLSLSESLLIFEAREEHGAGRLDFEPLATLLFGPDLDGAAGGFDVKVSAPGARPGLRLDVTGTDPGGRPVKRALVFNETDADADYDVTGGRPFASVAGVSGSPELPPGTEVRALSGLRDGYPALAVLPSTGQVLVVFGEETGPRTASIRSALLDLP